MKSRIATMAITVTKDGILPVTVAVLSIFNPVLGIAGTVGKAAWDILRKHQQDRIIEISKEVGQDTLISLFESEKCCDALYRTLRHVMDESSIKKRRLFYNYLNNLDKRSDLQKNNDLPYHSKIITVINQITFGEIDILNVCLRYEESFIKRNQDLIHSLGERIERIKHGLLEANLQQIGWAFEDIVATKPPAISIVRGAQALNSYGLIDINYLSGSVPPTYDGDMMISTNVIINSITPFGRKFWRFISKEE